MSSGAVLRLKKELQTITELQALQDILKQLTAFQYHAMDEERRRGQWTTFVSGGGGEESAASGGSTWPPAAARQEEGEASQTGLRPRAQQTPWALSLTATIETFFRLLPEEEMVHPFLAQPSDQRLGPLGLLIYTTDEGQVGGLNASVIEKALLIPGASRASLFVVGERGRAYFTETRRAFTAFPGFGATIDTVAVERLRDALVQPYLEGKVGRILVCYSRPVSFTRRDPEVFQLLPYTRMSPGQEGATRHVRPGETILEPSGPVIVEALIMLWLGRRLYETFWLSRLSELAARTMYLEAALQKLREMRKKVLLQYFRSKHEAMDTSIRETYAGQLMKKKAPSPVSSPPGGEGWGEG